MKTTSFNPSKNKFNDLHRKEKHFTESYEVVTFDAKRGFNNPITLRVYSTNSKVYVCVWVNAHAAGKRKESVHVSGSGSAGGYGYHRSSAAAQEALSNAGFTFDENISGRGNDAILSALNAVCVSLSFKKFTIVKAHA